MPSTTGQKLIFTDVGVELIVTVGGDADIDAVAADPGELTVGKRYESRSTGVQVLVTKAGSAALRCAGEAMVLREAKTLKAAD
ncbi:MAG: hypothetical protein JWM12_727 [Ilumatobacteraceae bacterium]|nr:hypothetical protein [Ilumatobacteraceae bacterium]